MSHAITHPIRRVRGRRRRWGRELLLGAGAVLIAGGIGFAITISMLEAARWWIAEEARVAGPAAELPRLKLSPEWRWEIEPLDLRSMYPEAEPRAGEWIRGDGGGYSEAEPVDQSWIRKREAK